MKIRLSGIIVLLIIMTAFAACVQQEPATGSAVITYTLYGGFVMPTYAIQELVVTKDMATYTIRSSDGTITKQFRKNLTKDQYNAIISVFLDNNFEAFRDRYVEGENYVTDVGYADINFTSDGKSKIVTTYNYNDFIPEGLVRIRERLRETIDYVTALEEGQIKKLAEDWVRAAPTYSYDGSGLTLVSYIPVETYPVRHVFTL